MDKNTAPSEIVLPDGYTPSDKEPFMNGYQKAYFRKKLMDWKADILSQTKETLTGMKDINTAVPDDLDRAATVADQTLELRARDRQRKLVSKIDKAIRRIDEGTYGYCDETGEPIGVRRLDARPIATLSIEAQEAHERKERVHRG